MRIGLPQASGTLPRVQGRHLVRASVATGEFTPVLVTVPNVELLEVGEDWHTSTGDFTWDEEDLLSAIESQADPAVRTPILKLGHIDPRFDGQPSIGRVENMAVTNNGQTLVGDLTGVPAWLAQIMPTGYPRRSIEGYFDYTFVDEKQKWPFVLTALALLGAMYPAITTLEDLPVLWGTEPPPMVEANSAVEMVHATRTDGNYIRAMRVVDLGRHVVQARQAEPREANAGMKLRKSRSATVEAAATSMDDVRRAFYDSLEADQWWWWIRQVLVNPLQLVVDDDDGGLYLVDVTMSGSDITFGEPQSVKVEYVAASLENLPRAPGQVVSASFASPQEAGAKVRATQSPEEEDSVKLSPEALAALGLTPEATEEDINKAVLAKATGEQPDSGATTPGASPEPAPETTPEEGDEEENEGEDQAPEGGQPTTEPPSAAAPAGAVLVDETQWKQMQKNVAVAAALAEKERVRERDDCIKAAVREGKFPRARIQHWTEAWEKDPEGTRTALASLSPGLIPVQEAGSAGDTDPAVAASYPDSWKPRTPAASSQQRVKVVND